MPKHPFDLSKLTATQRAITEDAIAAVRFDWMALVPKLQRTANKSLIPVEWVDLTRYLPDDAEPGHHHIHGEDGNAGHVLVAGAPDSGPRQAALGLAWSNGKISIEVTLEQRSHLLAKQVFVAEGAHMVDFFMMTDAERTAIYDAYHGGGTQTEHGHGWFDMAEYKDFVGESFMEGFSKAFSDLGWTMFRFSHETTDAVVEAIRTQLSEGAVEPKPPPPPPPEPVPAGIWPYLATIPTRYDRERDVLVYELEVHRHTGDWTWKP